MTGPHTPLMQGVTGKSIIKNRRVAHAQIQDLNSILIASSTSPVEIDRQTNLFTDLPPDESQSPLGGGEPISSSVQLSNANYAQQD